MSWPGLIPKGCLSSLKPLVSWTSDSYYRPFLITVGVLLVVIVFVGILVFHNINSRNTEALRIAEISSKAKATETVNAVPSVKKAGSFEVGKCYQLISDNPFEPPLRIIVTDIKGEYMQYKYRTDGIPWSDSLRSKEGRYVECSCE